MSIGPQVATQPEGLIAAAHDFAITLGYNFKYVYGSVMLPYMRCRRLLRMVLK